MHLLTHTSKFICEHLSILYPNCSFNGALIKHLNILKQGMESDYCHFLKTAYKIRYMCECNFFETHRPVHCYVYICNRRNSYM